MTLPELDADRLLAALGELQRAERTELARLEQPAQDLAARDPERAQALEERLMQELFAGELPRTQAVRSMPLRAAMEQPGLARSRRALWLMSAAATSVAMAAAGLLWARQPDAQPFEVAYTLVAPPPDAASRSPAKQGTSGVYSLGRTLAFALRPAVRYDGALSVACYAAQEDEVVRLDPQVELEPAGGARVVLSASMLQRALHEGRWQLQFYVSPPSATAVSAAQVRAAQCPAGARCLTFDARFIQPTDP